MTITRETIYKRTSSGKVQIWYGELDGNGSYRTVSGQQDGKKTVSAWTVCEPKNPGKANATTAIEQAAAELDATYRKKLAREYRRDLDKIDVLLYTEPMKCLKWYDDAKKRPAPGTTIGVQPKFDGMRCLASAQGCKSQDGLIIPGAPHISEALQELFAEYPALELDGELYNHDYKEDFEGLMSGLKREPKTPADKQRAREIVQYHIYDAVLSTPYYMSEDEGRYQFVQSLFDEFLSKHGTMFQLCPMIIARMDAEDKVVEAIDDSYIEMGYEGSIVRVLNHDPYMPGKRPKSMFKVKNFQDDEFPLEDVMEGKGNWAGFAKAIRVRLPNGNICKASVKGNKAYAKQLLDDWNSGKLKKGAMCTVSYLRYSKKGMLNLPIFKSVRWDV